MKGKFYKSNYALNRNKKAIVYKNADGTILEITFEKIAAGNPNFTEDDFAKLKEFSDQLYLEEQRGDVTYERAIEYLTVPEVSHTSNKWEKGEYGKYTISNRVYKMTYDIYERSSWRSDKVKYDVRWNIYTNRPDYQSAYKVAGQERTCASRGEAEKYIQGRIKAYSHLFTEISPPIPKNLEKSFMVHGNLLPGYVTEETQKAVSEKSAEKKPSIRKQLSELKADKKDISQKPQRVRSENEIG